MIVEQLLHAAGSGALKHVQVREYVRYTNRRSIVEDFAPSPEDRPERDPMLPTPYKVVGKRQELDDTWTLELEPANGGGLGAFKPEEVGPAEMQRPGREKQQPDHECQGGQRPHRVELLGVERPELLIIKTGSIAIQAAELDPALADATTVINCNAVLDTSGAAPSFRSVFEPALRLAVTAACPCRKSMTYIVIWPSVMRSTCPTGSRSPFSGSARSHSPVSLRATSRPRSGSEAQTRCGHAGKPAHRRLQDDVGYRT